MGATVLAPIPNAKISYASAGFDSTGAPVAKDQEFTAADYAFFTNRIVKGSACPWMTVSGVPVKTVKAKISATMTFAEYEAYTSALPDGDPAPYETDTAGGKPKRAH